MEVLTSYAREQGTYIVTAVFVDEDGSSEIPTSITWTLTDESGTVINSRQDVVISAASTINIVLSGDDLTLDEGVGVNRIVLIEWIYDSTLGSNLPGKNQCKFPIEKMVGG